VALCAFASRQQVAAEVYTTDFKGGQSFGERQSSAWSKINYATLRASGELFCVDLIAIFY
jgi:hypothetical protein